MILVLLLINFLNTNKKKILITFVIQETPIERISGALVLTARGSLRFGLIRIAVNNFIDNPPENAAFPKIKDFFSAKRKYKACLPILFYRVIIV